MTYWLVALCTSNVALALCEICCVQPCLAYLGYHASMYFVYCLGLAFLLNMIGRSAKHIFVALVMFDSSFQTWTKEETDQLFELCERFDLRFIIIADRFPTQRTVEELKDRYYKGMLYYQQMITLAYHCTVQNLKFLDLNGWFCIFFIVSRAILVARAPTPADVAAHPLVKVWIFPFLVVHLSIRAKDLFCISCSQVLFTSCFSIGTI